MCPEGLRTIEVQVNTFSKAAVAVTEYQAHDVLSFTRITTLFTVFVTEWAHQNPHKMTAKGKLSVPSEVPNSCSSVGSEAASLCGVTAT